MILIGYVHGGNLQSEFVDSLFKVCMFDKLKDTGRFLLGGNIAVKGLYVADSRNIVVARFLGARYPNGDVPQWLFFLDTDMVFTANQFYALYDRAQSKGPCVYGGLYFSFNEGKPDPVWRKIHPNTDFGWGTMGQIRLDTVEPVDAVGMGFTLIHREVLEAFPDNDDNWRWFGHDLWKGKHLGEDLSFCLRAKNLGYTTWGDSEVIPGHEKKYILDRATFIKEATVYAEEQECSLSSEDHKTNYYPHGKSSEG